MIELKDETERFVAQSAAGGPSKRKHIHPVIFHASRRRPHPAHRECARSVLLPEPDRPSIARNSPRLTERSACFRTVTSLSPMRNVLRIPWARTMGKVDGRGGVVVRLGDRHRQLPLSASIRARFASPTGWHPAWAAAEYQNQIYHFPSKPAAEPRHRPSARADRYLFSKCIEYTRSTFCFPIDGMSICSCRNGKQFCKKKAHSFERGGISGCSKGAV